MRPPSPSHTRTVQKAVYWREDELLTRAGHQLANDLPANADRRVTAIYLRPRKLRTVYGRTQ
jgi:hypothetical protein